MIAVDTSVLALVLLQNDVAPHKKVKPLFKIRETFTALVTVLLELVWRVRLTRSLRRRMLG